MTADRHGGGPSVVVPPRRARGVVLASPVWLKVYSHAYPVPRLPLHRPFPPPFVTVLTLCAPRPRDHLAPPQLGDGRLLEVRTARYK